MRVGRWPTFNEFAFWDANRRFPKPGELAKLTREKKKQKTEKRRIAAKRAAETRRNKSPEVRKWEQARRALQAAQKEDMERASAAKIRRPLRAHRWYDFFYISLTHMSIDEIHGLLLAMKARGVKAFRIEREVPIGEYKDPNDFKSQSGFISTKFQFMARLRETDLRYGNAKTGLPSLQAMRSPGIDYMRYLVIDDVSVRDAFPKAIVKELFRKARRTNKDAPDDDVKAWYLSKGKMPSKKQIAAMRAQQKAIDTDIEEEDEENDE